MEINQIIRRWQAKEGPPQIAAGTGLSRNTVRKYLAAARLQGITQGGPATTGDQLSRLATISQVGPRPAATPRQDQLEPWADQIYQWITKDRLQMTRIHELLAMRGCDLSYQSLRRFIINRNRRRRGKTTVRMADTPPEEVAEADFGRLGMITDPATGKRKAVWAMVIDNFPAAVVGTDPLHPVLTRGFLEYAQHRGFIPDPARKGHPQDKPKVERKVPYARDAFTRTLISTTSPTSAPPRPYGAWRSSECASTAPPARNPWWSGWTASWSASASAVSIKTHTRQPKGGRSTDVDDYPPKVAPYTTRAPDGLKRAAAKLGTAVGEFAERLFDGDHPWSKIRQGHKLLRLAERYIAQRLDAACQRALDVDLIDVYRVERILVQALEAETTPQLPLPLPPGRFARPGSVFAHAAGGRS